MLSVMLWLVLDLAIFVAADASLPDLENPGEPLLSSKDPFPTELLRKNRYRQIFAGGRVHLKDDLVLAPVPGIPKYNSIKGFWSRAARSTNMLTNNIVHSNPMTTKLANLKGHVYRIPFMEEFFRIDWYRFIPLYTDRYLKMETSDRIVSFLLQEDSWEECHEKSNVVAYFGGRVTDVTYAYKFLRSFRDEMPDTCFIALEYPGFGESRFSNGWAVGTEDSVKGASRTLAAYLVTVQKFKQSKITFLGFSLGTACAIDAAVGIDRYNRARGDLNQDLSTVALIGAYKSGRAIVGDALAKYLRLGSVGRALPHVFIRNWYNNEKKLKYLKNPTVYIHGQKDQFISLPNAIDLCAYQPSTYKVMYTVKDTDHFFKGYQSRRAAAEALKAFLVQLPNTRNLIVDECRNPIVMMPESIKR